MKPLGVTMMVYLVPGGSFFDFFDAKDVINSTNTSVKIVSEDHRKINSSIYMVQPSSVQPMRLQDGMNILGLDY